MKPKNKVPSSFDIDITQKKAMYVIYQNLGIPQTGQVKSGLDKFLYEHRALLKNYGFTFTNTGSIESKTK